MSLPKYFHNCCTCFDASNKWAKVAVFNLNKIRKGKKKSRGVSAKCPSSSPVATTRTGAMPHSPSPPDPLSRALRVDKNEDPEP